MSCNVGDFISCPAIQNTLNSQFNGLTGLLVEPNPFLEFITSPVNTQGTLQKQIDEGNGHVRQVTLLYESRLLENAVSNSSVQSCTGGTKSCEDSYTYDIDTTLGSSYKFTYAQSDLINRCEDDATYFARQIMKMMDVIERKIGSDSWVQAVLGVGKFVGGVSGPINAATKNSSGVYIGDLIQKIRYQFMLMGYSSAPVVFGGSEEFSNYFNAMGAMCCNTAQGLDLGNLLAQQPVVPFFDYKANDKVGSNQMLAMAPGSYQLLTYNEYKGPRRVLNTDVYQQGTVISPRSGLEFDYMASFSCGTWTVQLKLAHKLVTLPNDLFQSADRLSGITWSGTFKIVNP
jgi:hypothetical protein